MKRVSLMIKGVLLVFIFYTTSINNSIAQTPARTTAINTVVDSINDNVQRLITPSRMRYTLFRILDAVKDSTDIIALMNLQKGIPTGFASLDGGGKIPASQLPTETDPTVGSWIKAITAGDITNWNAAFGWGNHASAGYLVPIITSPTEGQILQYISGAWRNVNNNISADGNGIYGGNGLLGSNTTVYFNEYDLTIRGSYERSLIIQDTVFGLNTYHWPGLSGYSSAGGAFPVGINFYDTTTLKAYLKFFPASNVLTLDLSNNIGSLNISVESLVNHKFAYNGDVYLGINGSSGKVGIGTETPQELFHVVGKVRIDDTLKMPNLITQTDTTTYHAIVSDAQGNTFVLGHWPVSSATGLTDLNGLITSTQSFAISGTGSDFDIISSGSTHTFQLPNASSSSRGLISSTDWNSFNNRWSLVGNSGTNTTSNFVGTIDNVGLNLRTNNTNRIKIEAGGNVGIGSDLSSPLAALLEISSSFGAELLVRRTSTLNTEDAATLKLSGVGTPVNNDVIGAIYFSNNITGLQYGIGSKIYGVAEGTWSTGGGGQTPGGIAFQTTPPGSGSFTPLERVRIASSGNVGIGISTPIDRLHINGTVRITDTLKMPNLEQKAWDSTNYRLLVVDVSGNTFGMYWPTYNSKVNISDTLSMLAPYIRDGFSGLTKVGQALKWGGTLSEISTINTSTNRIIFTGTSTVNTLQVDNTSTGHGVSASISSGSTAAALQGNGSTAGTGVRGIASTGIGVHGTVTGATAYAGYFESSGNGGTGIFGSANNTNGIGVWGNSNEGIASQFNVNPAATNTIVDAIRIYKTTSGGIPNNNSGGAISYFNEVNDNSSQRTTRLTSRLIDSALATYTASLDIAIANNGTLVDRLIILGNGSITASGYATITKKTDTTNIKPLGYNISTGLYEPMQYWVGSGTGGGSGTLTDITAGDLSPLFTTNITNSTTTPDIQFTLSNAGAKTVFANNTNSPAPPAFVTYEEFADSLPPIFFRNPGLGDTLLVYEGVDSFLIKSLIAGTNITFDITDTSITVNSTGGGLSDPGANGILARPSLNTTVARTLTGTANLITVADGDGVSGNPTFNVGSNVARLDIAQSWAAIPTFSGGGIIVSGGTGVIDLRDQSGGEELQFRNNNQTLILRARQDAFDFRDVMSFSLETTAGFLTTVATDRLSIGAGASPTATLHLAASTTGQASLRVPSGTAPTAPNHGDIWTDASNMYVQLNGVTKQLNDQGGGGGGDFSSNTSTSVDNEIVLFSGTGGKTGKRATQTGLLLGTSGVLSGVTTSAGISGAISDETGSGALVFGTTPTFTTNITVPVIQGGTAVGSDLVFKPTTATADNTSFIDFTTGINGGTRALRITNSGRVEVGNGGSANANDLFYVYRNAAGNYNPLGAFEDDLADGYVMFGLRGTGRTFNFGVGNASETAFSAANNFFIFDETASTMRLLINATGQLTITNLAGTGTRTPQVSSTGQFSAITNTGTGNNVLATSPTIVTPTIASFTNATHNHTNAAGGGQLTDAALSSAVTVSKGGTGLSTTTAYGLITGGTTSTGAFQNAGTGTTGQILVSNGSAALPTWQSQTTAITTSTYAPSITESTNCNGATYGSTIYDAAYYRFGDWVYVFVIIGQGVSSNVWTEFDINLPVSADLTSTGHLFGSGSIQDGTTVVPVSVTANQTNDRATINFVAPASFNGGGQPIIRFSFVYFITPA